MTMMDFMETAQVICALQSSEECVLARWNPLHSFFCAACQLRSRSRSTSRAAGSGTVRSSYGSSVSSGASATETLLSRDPLADAQRAVSAAQLAG
jgi:hypothetical protein